MKKPVIICVDDEQIVLNVLGTQLKRKFGDKYTYEFAESAEEALEVIDEMVENGYTIVIIITDQLMPGITGDQFLVSIHKKHPKPIKVLLTGQAGLESAINSINNADLYRYITKPWEEEDFLLTVEKGIKQYHLMEVLEKQVEVFGKFVPKQFLECLEVKDFNDIDTAKPKQMNLSILFSDIRNFTSLSESMSPNDSFDLLNNYFAKVSQPIEENHGFIDKFIGDGIMALFNRSAYDAVKSAIEMQRKIKELNGDSKKKDLPKIRMGIGINKGNLILGTVGSDKRIDGTVVGDAANVAARMEGLTKFYDSEIIISENVYKALENPGDFKIRKIDYVNVLGKEKPIEIYEVFGANDSNVIEKKEKQLPVFSEGLSLFYSKQWDEAIKKMEESLTICPEDKLPGIYIERCKSFKQREFTEDWDGSVKMDRK